MSSSKLAFPTVYTQRPPLQNMPDEDKPGQLSEEQIDQFFKEGFIILDKFVDHGLIDEVIEEWKGKVDGIAENLFKAGKIKNKYEDEDFYHRMMKINEEFPAAHVLMHKIGIMGRASRDLWSYDKLLNVLEQLIGPEVSGNPVWNIRIKVPGVSEADVPWHQDNGYFTDDVQETLMVTAWIPMHDTNSYNGGMEMVRRSHRKGILAQHFCCAADTWYIDMDESAIENELGADMSKDRVECVVPKGSVLLFSNAIAHRSFPNFSDGIRWSMDLRWQDPRKPNGRAGMESKDMMPLMRSRLNPVKEIDWSVLVNRQENDIKAAGGEVDEDPFDTRIAGAWMKKWPIRRTNRHTAMARL